MGERWAVTSYQDQTTLHPMGLAAVLLLGVLTVLVSRRWAVVPMLLMAAGVSSAQRIVIGGLDWSLLRIMVLWGVTRILARGELKGHRWNRTDYWFFAWVGLNSLIYSIQWSQAWAVTNRLGFAFEAIGIYVVVRVLIRDWKDLEAVSKAVAIMACASAPFFLFEHATRHNVFSLFGGVPSITMVRDGRLRCQGPFSHPILAGCFWAALAPIAWVQWRSGPVSKMLAIASTPAVFFIIFACASSTPVLGLLAAMIAASLFVVRRRMLGVRWAVVITLFCLHMVMQAPVWHLIARVSAVGGSTGYHRYRLIDAAIHRFPEWALMGTRSTAHWGYWLFDVTNQYILQAVQGGALTLIAFVVNIWLVFAGLGRSMKLLRHDRRRVEQLWLVGCSMFVHCTCFIGVSYFGQLNMLWYFTLALGASAGAIVTQTAAGVPNATARPVAPGARPIPAALRPGVRTAPAGRPASAR